MWTRKVELIDRYRVEILVYGIVWLTCGIIAGCAQAFSWKSIPVNVVIFFAPPFVAFKIWPFAEKIDKMHSFVAALLFFIVFLTWAVSVEALGTILRFVVEKGLHQV